MKKVLKKLNRGLILTLIVAIIFAIYVMYDNKQFKKEIPVIEQVVSEYITEYSKAMITPTGMSEINKNYGEADYKAQHDNIVSVIDKYWTQHSATDYSFDNDRNMSSFKSSINGYLKQRYNPLTINLKSVDIEKVAAKRVSKSAPGFASAEVEFSYKANVEDASFGYYDLLPIFMDNYSDMYGWEMPAMDEDEEFPVVEEDRIVTQISEIKLMKIDGEWKIINIGYGYASW